MDPYSTKLLFYEGRIVDNYIFRDSQIFLGWVYVSDIIVINRNRLDLFVSLPVFLLEFT